MDTSKIGSLTKGRCRVCVQVYAGEKRGWVWLTGNDNSTKLAFWKEGEKAKDFGNTTGALEVAYELVECLAMNFHSSRVVVTPECMDESYWMNPVVEKEPEE